MRAHIAGTRTALVEKLRVCLEREHLRRTGLMTVLVGTWLTLINQIDLPIAGGLTLGLALKILLNYATPFVVSNAGLLSRQEDT